MKSTQAVISLGSNLAYSPAPPSATGPVSNAPATPNSPAELLNLALCKLHKLSQCSLTVSSFYRSAALDCAPDAPDFVNAVALVQVADNVSASDLLCRLQIIESQFGRRRSGVVNEPRTLDLDLISFGDLQCHEPDLILPHPRAHRRGFVMVPLAEIAPDYVLPGQTLTAMQFAEAIAREPQQQVSICQSPGNYSSD